MFTRVNGRVADGNVFMDSLVPNSNGRENKEELLNGFSGHREKRLKDISRLWQYRNGGKPQD